MVATSPYTATLNRAPNAGCQRVGVKGHFQYIRFHFFYYVHANTFSHPFIFSFNYTIQLKILLKTIFTDRYVYYSYFQWTKAHFRTYSDIIEKSSYVKTLYISAATNFCYDVNGMNKEISLKLSTGLSPLIHNVNKQISVNAFGSREVQFNLLMKKWTLGLLCI